MHLDARKEEEVRLRVGLGGEGVVGDPDQLIPGHLTPVYIVHTRPAPSPPPVQ